MQQIVVTAALLVGALVYLRTLPDVLPAWRLAAFMSGMFLMWAVVGSPLAALDHELLTFHMLQHLVLMTVAAPLILLGLHGNLPRIAQSFGRFLTHPVFCWLASTVTVIGWHVPALFALGMRSERWHLTEHACFFAAGILFWLPVIRPWPSLEQFRSGVRASSALPPTFRSARTTEPMLARGVGPSAAYAYYENAPATGPRWSVPLYLFLATLPCDALSAFLTFCNRVVYPHYLYAQRLFDVSALGDQEVAGALMWFWVTFAYLAPAAAVTIRLLSPQRLASPAEVV
jgi:putative membrane protein